MSINPIVNKNRLSNVNVGGSSSSITGDKVNVNVGNNTHLKGSLLASGNYDENGVFQDNKNLNFTTNTLTFGNSSNNSYSSNKSLGANVNYNLNSKNDKNQDVQKGISSVGYQAENSLSVNASKTLATLGQGNVIVKDVENSDELDRLNRDTTAVNKDLYSSSTGTKVDGTLDTRLLTKDGQEQIAKEVEQLADKVKIIGSYISNYDKILEIRENPQNVNLRITQELDKLKEENPQLYKDTLIAIQEYNNASKEQQDINGQLAFAPAAIVISPLVTELLISAGIITTVVALTEDNRNNLVGGGINGEEQGNKNLPPFEIDKNNGNLPSFDKSKEENSNIGGIEADPNINRPNVGGVHGQEQGSSIYLASDKAVFKTEKEAKEVAKQLGYIETNYTVKGAKVYKKGNSYIVRDLDNHNGGAWKEASSVKELSNKNTRNGTFDKDLNRIGD
ncbi:toxin C-terminal domain-containing protein [Aliarcobacter cryaerophilus]|uniref:toxin C-terminal domain-containing protein n=1 Tax=Aliarcobacter cryaerophilus TaxID=28198 RepID=UPI001CA363C9|nr:toxin C-terminal domain-containing protein [Aliarcobacter cryaerophilus]